MLDYVTTYPRAFLRYYVSKIQLIVDSDASYLVLLKSRSRIAEFFCLDPTLPPILKHDDMR